jgi:hypothetical protein
MLILLIRTRLRYYRNYLRHHFDRTARIEIAFIILILIFMIGRSPADIGYNVKFLSATDFPLRWAFYWRCNCWDSTKLTSGAIVIRFFYKTLVLVAFGSGDLFHPYCWLTMVAEYAG